MPVMLQVIPANITITTYPFDPEFADVISRVDGVAQAEGRREVTVRVKTGDTYMGYIAPYCNSTFRISANSSGFSQDGRCCTR